MENNKTYKARYYILKYNSNILFQGKYRNEKEREIFPSKITRSQYNMTSDIVSSRESDVIIEMNNGEHSRLDEKLPRFI